MRPPWYFVLPEERRQPSGGNIYNERIIQALQQVGQSVEIISAIDYPQAVRRDQEGVYWVDTLILESIREVLSLQPSRAHSLLIVHHLESLAPAQNQSAEKPLAQETPFLLWFQGFLATSTFTRDYLRQRGLSQPIIIAEPGIDNPNLAISDRDTETVRALMVANLVERKGALPWLQWLADSVQSSDYFFLTIVGRTNIEPNYAQACINLVKKHPLLESLVNFLGSQPPSRMSRFYEEANLFISTAQMETFGMALQEARLYRLPILTLDGGYSARHIAPGETGYVFNDIASLGDFFLDAVQKPQKFATLYERAQQPSLSYPSWADTARSLVQQFDQLFRYAP
ncbi:MAG: glycosyltransferase family 4 protein [Bacteroidota bacterium]